MTIEKEFLAEECGVDFDSLGCDKVLTKQDIIMQDRINNIYAEIIENIRLKIVSDYGSISKFCNENGFNKSTLSRVFNRSQNLSLTHYIKILVSLGVLTPDINTNFDANLTVIDYLKIDHNSVSQSFLTMIIGG